MRDKYADTINVGLWVRLKYRAMARTKGTLHTAKILRKQGYPIEVAQAVLL